MSLLVSNFYRFGPFDLDPDQRALRRDGKKIALPPKAIDLLLYLVQNPLRPLTKEELLRAVWPDSFVEEGNLSQNIFLLRKAITPKQKDFRYIVTLPGRGYQFTAAVELIPCSPGQQPDVVETQAANLSSTHSTIEPSNGSRISALRTKPIYPPKNEPSGSPRQALSFRHLLAALFILAFGAASFLWWKHHHQPPASEEIVLADFDNRTGDPAFDDVLDTALEVDLTQSPYLDVMSDQDASNVLRLMGRKPDATITEAIATEICQRADRQVMLSGSVSSLGRHYLLALQATDCFSGKRLAEVKAEATDKDKVLPALDRAADKLRHDLGESAPSVEHFQVSIAQATTSSLEALKAYSIGEYMVSRAGKDETETLPMFLRCIELDPNFAMAYVAIATDYFNLNEPKLASPYYQKAFDLSEQVSEKEKLYIRAHYYADAQKDLEQGIKTYQLWAETYPRDWGPWLNIAKAYTQLGQEAPAIAAAQQALRLDPSRGINYTILAQAYLHDNRFADAKSAALQDVKIGKDSYNLHALLFELAFIDHDQAAMAHEVAWSQGRPSAWYSLQFQALAAASQGRYRLAEELFHTAYNVAQREDLAEAADDILVKQASMELESGWPQTARTTLRRISSQNNDNPEFAWNQARFGDTAFAERFLAFSNSNRSGTLMTYVELPRLRAEIALHRGKPQEAIADLETTPYELAGSLELFAQRGEAYQKANHPEQAIAEYRKLLAHQGLDPLSPLLPLAHLWLARTEAQSGHLQESKSEYEKLFALWKDADKDLPPLQVAQREYAALNTSLMKKPPASSQ
jgi:DNA-binding winged helix-turn-helix (wHTH) protein/tetratricopeptide (TPR) repeat protein